MEDATGTTTHRAALIGANHQPTSSLATLRAALSKRKTLAEINEEVARDQASDTSKFSLFDLLCIGIGGTLGSGVFVLTGQVLPVAGPAATLSWLFAGAVCLLSGLSYMCA
jgi:amino acid permease